MTLSSQIWTDKVGGKGYGTTGTPTSLSPAAPLKPSGVLIRADGEQFGAGADRRSCTAPVQAAGLEQIKAQIVIESDGKRI